MKCNLCGKDSEAIFVALVLRKHNVQYYYCKSCEYMQTEKPFWLEESYSETINISDTGLVWRNIKLSKITSLLLFMCFSKNATYLDYGGGFGMFTRLMRDIGYNFFTTDPFTKNTLARGFDYQGGAVELLTSFECFEHFEQPLQNVESMLQISKNILFTTEVLPTPPPNVSDWWYYAPGHGQHISFYSQTALKKIAARFNLRSASFRNLHIFTERNIGRSQLALAYLLGRLNLHPICNLKVKSKTASDSKRLSMYGVDVISNGKKST